MLKVSIQKAATIIIIINSYSLQANRSPEIKITISKILTITPAKTFVGVIVRVLKCSFSCMFLSYKKDL